MSQVLTGSQSAFKTAYKEETIMGFERGETPLRSMVTTDYRESGGAVVFLIADSGNATAVTRGLNGTIPKRVVNNNQVTLSLTELHDLPTVTGYNIFASQGDTVKTMQQTAINTINRALDGQILTQLGTATSGPTDTATTDAYGLFQSSLTALGNNNVETDTGMVSAIISQGFLTRLQRVKEFSSADWVNKKAYEEGRSAKKIWLWQGVKLITHTGLSGTGTAAERCFMFHKNAIGHAMNKNTLDVLVGYNEEDDYSWTRATFFGGAKVLQNSGIMVMKHDASEFGTVTIT